MPMCLPYSVKIDLLIDIKFVAVAKPNMTNHYCHIDKQYTANTTDKIHHNDGCTHK